MKRIYYIISLFLFVQLPSIHAQIPRFVPNPADNKAVDWSNPADLILYFVLPIIFIFLGIISWKYKKKRNT